MSKKITILGCGYLGKALAEASLAMDWEVSAFTRNEATAKDLRGAGVHQVVVGRLEDQAWHSKLSFEQDYIVNCVGATFVVLLPQRPLSKNYSMTGNFREK